jgi:hypothetical protein
MGDVSTGAAVLLEKALLDRADSVKRMFQAVGGRRSQWVVVGRAFGSELPDSTRTLLDSLFPGVPVVFQPDGGGALARGAFLAATAMQRKEHPWVDVAPRLALQKADAKGRPEWLDLLDPGADLVPGTLVDQMKRSPTLHVPAGARRVTFPVSLDTFEKQTRTEEREVTMTGVLEDTVLPLSVPVEVRVGVRFRHGEESVRIRLEAVSPGAPFQQLELTLQQGVAMPGERRLAELLRQLRQLHALGHDRELLWQHGSVAVRCKQGRVVLSSG